MKKINLQDFQKLSGLSDKAMLWLLINGKLPISLDSNTITIDPSGLDMRSLIQSIAVRVQERFSSHQALIEERLESLIAEKLEDLVEEAIARMGNAV